MKRHSQDVVSLVFGLVFLLVAGLWVLWRIGTLDRDSVTWVPAAALILIGLIGLTLSIARSRAATPYAGDDDADSLLSAERSDERP